MGLLVEIGVVGLAVWMMWRGFTQHRRNVGEAVRRAEKTVDEARPLTLVKDPKTGVYRPKQ